MNEYYSDMMLLGMKPFTNLHRLGVNGKQSGSLAAIQEIPNVVTVMYGPRGCGFHYRNTVRVRSGPVPNLECAELADQDVIFGGNGNCRRFYGKLMPGIILKLFLFCPQLFLMLSMTIYSALCRKSSRKYPQRSS